MIIQFPHLLCFLLAVVPSGSLGAFAPVAGTHQDQALAVEQSGTPPRLVVFSKTAGYRHTSIPVGVTCLTELAVGLGFEVIATEDSTVFSTEGLSDVSFKLS